MEQLAQLLQSYPEMNMNEAPMMRNFIQQDSQYSNKTSWQKEEQKIQYPQINNVSTRGRGRGRGRVSGLYKYHKIQCWAIFSLHQITSQANQRSLSIKIWSQILNLLVLQRISVLLQYPHSIFLGIQFKHQFKFGLAKKIYGYQNDGGNIEEELKQSKKIKQHLSAADRKNEEYKLEPPDDFLDIQIVPTLDELRYGIPFLRAIPKNGGSFRNPKDYIDLMFRVLREDAILPLRKGLKLMTKQEQMSYKDFNLELKHSGCRLFDNVEIVDIAISRFAEDLSLKVRIYERRSQNWNISKKLLNGSLLMLSSDNFQTAKFCLVANRDVKEMTITSKNFRYADLEITIVNEEGFDQEEKTDVFNFLNDNKSKIFKIVESTAYFESYYHVLKKLKEMAKWDTFPLQEYLLGRKRDNIFEPNLLRELQLQNRDQLNNLKGNFKMGIQQANLDQSQTLAIQSCFFKEFSLIQGPPGTGKTYIGENFVRIMVENRAFWRANKGPILLVCYTNHALDQFLNLISKYTQKFLRFGGRCQDEHLLKYQIRNYIKEKEIKFPPGYRQNIQDSEKLVTKILAEKSRIQLSTLGAITSISKNEDAKILVGKIIKTFKYKVIQTLDQKLKTTNQSQDQKNAMAGVEKYIKNLLLVEKDISVIFWLEIVDLEKYIDGIWAQILDKTIDPEGKIDFIEQSDDIDQRQQDQDDNTENREAFLKQIEKQSKEALKVEQKIQNLAKIYHQKIQGQRFRNSQTFSQCVNEGQMYSPMNIEFQYRNPFTFTFEQRWQLNNYFESINNDANYNMLRYMFEEFKNINKQLKQKELITFLQAIKEVDIVAMTTTGCAKYSDILSNQNFSIVIVEEAAEVFEANILTALSKNTEHLILIGDHQQLRPSPACYEMESLYNLSLSMFERLIKNNFEYVTLLNQRRMRPEISQMIRMLYPGLSDDEKVKTYPQIKGIDKSVYFFDHEFEEQVDEGNLSKLNMEEGFMIIRFTFYLLQQNYLPKNITILSLYMAQSQFIKSQIRRSFEQNSPMTQVKVITVDNFQGEENEIIILSLVRSNQQNEIGYLKISNRVCVALSRAKHGMFIFGNATCLERFIDAQQNKNYEKTLQEQSQLWANVLGYLREQQFIGKSLNLCCANHKNITQIFKPEDFTNVQEGGCKLQCESRLSCGHRCSSLCHNYIVTDQNKTGHENFKCFKTCQREHPCKHPCGFQCHQCKSSLQGCIKMVQKQFQQCGHKTQIQCQYSQTARCQEDCKKILDCGHKCRLKCPDDCFSKKCIENVTKKLPCGHYLDLKCHITPEEFMKNDRFGCPKACGVALDCGHYCQEKCGDCSKKDFHGICNFKVDNVLQCGHVNKATCGTKSLLCQQKCEVRCIHSACQKKCYEPCDLCVERCSISCKHTNCQQKCFQACDKKLCLDPCQEFLYCQHPCIGLCGDECPQVCRICSPNHETFEILFGYEQDEDARFVKIDCGHIFESKSLDQLIETSKQSGQVKFPECPRCKKPIKTTLRYKNKINQTLIDMNRIKQINLQKYQEVLRDSANLQQRYKQLLTKSFQLKQIQRDYLHKILQSWYNLFVKSQTNEQMLQNCTIKLELLSFLVAFYTFMFRVETGEFQKNQKTNNLFSFCKVSVDQIISKKFVINETIKNDMRKKAEEAMKDYDFKAPVDMIQKALGLGKGHFYKCPNGHLYVITECGGAMEVGKCNECGEQIGGNNHQLLQSNTASNVDGSTGAAWDPNGFDQQVLDGRINLNNIVRD